MQNNFIGNNTNNSNFSNNVTQENYYVEDNSEAAHSNSCPICLDSIDEVTLFEKFLISFI